RLLSIALCIALSLSVLSSTVFAADKGLHNFQAKSSYQTGQFTDVSNGAWFESNVAQVYNLGLMTGNSSTTFNPSGKITQAEVLTITARIHKIYTTGNDDFSDIKQEMQDMNASIWEWCNFDESSPAYKEFYNAWYAPYVYYLYSRVWIEGRAEYPQFPALAFEPSDAPFIETQIPITRERFVSYLIGSLPESELQQINTVDNDAIPDVTYTGNPDVYLLYRAGVLTGSDSLGTFNPTSHITRAEVAAIIARMVDPSLRKNITLTAGNTSENSTSSTMMNSAGCVAADTKEIQINVRNTVSIMVQYTGNSEIIANYDSSILRVQWGEWDGDRIPLTITAFESGYSELEIYAKDDMSSCIYIDVWVKGENESNSSLTIIGIGKEFETAKGLYRNFSVINSADYQISQNPSDGSINIEVDVIATMVKLGDSPAFGGFGYIAIKYELINESGVYVKTGNLWIDVNYLNEQYAQTIYFFDLKPGNYTLKFRDNYL
ncbi:MAG: S-layer homology domain-containing protein, partial [Oscillospiraceae bacterium]|nr:S-layer homology domain-containing protein [Oscillospiraceae bacterium]